MQDSNAGQSDDRQPIGTEYGVVKIQLEPHGRIGFAARLGFVIESVCYAVLRGRTAAPEPQTTKPKLLLPQ